MLQSAELMELNPDVYSVWNYRKCAFLVNFEEAKEDEEIRDNLVQKELKLVRSSMHFRTVFTTLSLATCSRSL